MGTIKDKAQELLAGRMGALDALEEANARADRARAELKDAEAAVASAWTAATAAGWTAAELRTIGVEQPASRRGGRPTGRRRTTTSTSRRAATSDTSTPDARTDNGQEG